MVQWWRIHPPIQEMQETGSILGLGRSPGERNGNPLQYSSLENPLDRGAWWARIHGFAKSGTRLSPQANQTLNGICYFNNLKTEMLFWDLVHEDRIDWRRKKVSHLQLLRNSFWDHLFCLSVLWKVNHAMAIFVITEGKLSLGTSPPSLSDLRWSR